MGYYARAGTLDRPADTLSGISAQTFYRWRYPYDPYDLRASSLKNAPDIT
jgi:hypothetical protein